MKISELIQKDFILVNESETIKNVLNIMTDKKVNSIPVVDDNNLLVGMVVKADIYRFMVEPGHYSTYPVKMVMTKNVITAEMNEGINAVAQRLVKNNIVAMPVMDKEVIKGVVSVEELLDYYSKE